MFSFSAFAPGEGTGANKIGLKTLAKRRAKTRAHALIKEFGWLVQRVTMDSSATIPSAVLTYCAAIRKDCNDICTAIDDAIKLGINFFDHLFLYHIQMQRMNT